MADYQLTQRQADRRTAAHAVGVDPRAPKVFAVQFLSADQMQQVMKMLGGGLEDSTLMEIVNPATGHFWHQNGISASGGTDDARP